MTTYARSSSDITAGIEAGALAGLDPAQRRIVVTLIARAAEQGYRRGVQQGATFAKAGDRLRGDLHDWRYLDGTDASPAADGTFVEPAVSRLHTENSGLRRMGLPIEATAIGTLDEEAAIERLYDLAGLMRAAREQADDTAYRFAQAHVRAFGIELAAVGGYRALSEVYDGLVERHGERSAAGVEPAWTGIGTWSA